MFFGGKRILGLNEGVNVQVEWALKSSSLWGETFEVPVVGGEVVEELPMWSKGAVVAAVIVGEADEPPLSVWGGR